MQVRKKSATCNTYNHFIKKINEKNLLKIKKLKTKLFDQLLMRTDAQSQKENSEAEDEKILVFVCKDFVIISFFEPAIRLI